MCGFAKSDDFDFRELRKIVGLVVDRETVSGAGDAALHDERNVDGGERLQEDAARDQLGIVHVMVAGQFEFRTYCVTN